MANFTAVLHYGPQASDDDARDDMPVFPDSPSLKKDEAENGRLAVAGEGFSFAFSKHYAVILCGCFVNRQELVQRARLEPSASLADILLALISELPLQVALNLLNGPFSGLVYDKDKNELDLFRDQLGRDFLFFGINDDSKAVYISNRLDCLAGRHDLDCSVDPVALGDYFSVGYIAAPRTIYRGIRKVEAGHCLRMDGGKIKSNRRYWEIPHETGAAISFNEATEQAGKLLKQAVARCIELCPRMGFLLSGGIDSGLLMGMTRQQDQRSGAAVTIAFCENDYDESNLASMVAAIHEVPHVLRLAGAADTGRMTRFLKVAGEPFADSSLLPTGMAVGFSAENHPMILTGNGGDEIFGGYRRYSAMKMRHCLAGIPGKMAHFMARGVIPFLPQPAEVRSRYGGVYRTIHSLALPPLNAFASFQEIFDSEARGNLLNGDLIHTYIDDWKALLAEKENYRFPDAYNHLDVLYYMPEDCCRKMNIACQAANVGELAPMMDMDVVNFALKLPVDYRFSYTKGKIILRTIATDYLPDEVINQKKRGFGLPIASWFRTELADSLRSMAASADEWDRQNLLNHVELKKLVQRHLDGQANHASKIWTVFCLYNWLKINLL